jgi:hypothetical protein
MRLLVLTIVLGACSASHGMEDAGVDGGAISDGGGRRDGGGGRADAGGRDWGACDVPSDCGLTSNTCCGVCGRPTLAAYEAVRRDLATEYFHDVACPDWETVGCPDCAVMPNPSLVATCAMGLCAGIDVEAHRVSECTADTDCIVRTPQCCECGAPTGTYDVVAMNASRVMEYMSLVCDPDTGCDFCAPDPPTATAFCGDDGHCHVDLESGS